MYKNSDVCAVPRPENFVPMLRKSELKTKKEVEKDWAFLEEHGRVFKEHNLREEK